MQPTRSRETTENEENIEILACIRSLPLDAKSDRLMSLIPFRFNIQIQYLSTAAVAITQGISTALFNHEILF